MSEINKCSVEDCGYEGVAAVRLMETSVGPIFVCANCREAGLWEWVGPGPVMKSRVAFVIAGAAYYIGAEPHDPSKDEEKARVQEALNSARMAGQEVLERHRQEGTL